MSTDDTRIGESSRAVHQTDTIDSILTTTTTHGALPRPSLTVGGRAPTNGTGARFRTTKGSKPNRIWRFLRSEIRRPSVLSNSSESAATRHDSYLESASPATQDALRVLGRLRTRKSHRSGTRRTETSIGALVDDLDEKDDGDPVEVVVIDNDMSEVVHSGILARHHSRDTTNGGYAASDGTASDGGRGAGGGGGGGRVRSLRSKTSATDLYAGRMFSKVKALWVLVHYFFDMRFAEESKERTYKREHYYGQRQMSLAAGAFFLLMWVWCLALTPHPWQTYHYIGFVGVWGFFTVPLLVFILINLPYRTPIFWQIWLALATWSLPILGLIGLKRCSNVDNIDAPVACSTQTDFIVFASAIGQSTLALLALGQSRFIASVGFVTWFVVMGIFYFGHVGSVAFYRDSIYYFIYHVFLIMLHFISEKSSRQTFELREQLKLQYKATQRAQVMEKKASDLTKRFVSYIFHEVRVPLNTALLSVQNLEGENLFDDFSLDQKEMVEGLTGSLSMMEKVLNDVLSFNRMETGTFTQAKVPFDLHKSIQLTAMSHTAPANVKGISLVMDLDPRIDRLECLFIGDEMRLRQITSNLVSNSIKFTQEGGVKIVTKLLYPKMDPLESTSSAGNGSTSTDPEKGSEVVEMRRNTRAVVVRIEVHDTGAGLRKRDVEDNRLFSPYVQTEMGRRQGGKGTGLGLALIRQIVTLSKGRLGVNSQYGKGSEFWLELPYPILPRPHNRDQSTSTNSSEATAVDLDDGFEKAMKSEKEHNRDLHQRHVTQVSDTDEENDVPQLPSAPPRPPIPMERHMTAEQFLVSDPLARDGRRNSESRQSLRSLVSRHDLSRTTSRHTIIHPAAAAGAAAGMRKNSGTSLPLTPGPDDRPIIAIRPDSVELKRVAFSRSISSDPAVRLPGAPVRSNPPSPRSKSPLRPSVLGDSSPSAVTVVASPQPLGINEISTSPLANRTPSPASHGQTKTHDYATGIRSISGSPALSQEPQIPETKAVPEFKEEDDEALDVLVVDDDKLTRMMMARMLKRLGHRVETAENGQIALDKITNAFNMVLGSPPVDVVFLDNQMPMMTGVEVARQVRNLGSPLFIVGCTGNALRQDQEEYIEAGADQILTKPIKQHRIEACLVEARRRKRNETGPNDLFMSSDARMGGLQSPGI
ncbi:hypothetical protein BD324DRAFT_649702 [Kockovaella imperatae]|uniref:Histidine kinase n=1 Tax=Kockovaella imperatae TaxID=4999 RepID=A0A1Y1ULG1_9TREE|nr:hypothetical protein BD324DRAFT_649702 [Kockovaella imperatae]ORX38326.1 hypothetical protein BD324DRAFT_649702 [Kockovaella imperatae]